MSTRKIKSAESFKSNNIFQKAKMTTAHFFRIQGCRLTKLTTKSESGDFVVHYIDIESIVSQVFGQWLRLAVEHRNPKPQLRILGLSLLKGETDHPSVNEQSK